MKRWSRKRDTLGSVEDLLIDILIFCAVIVFIYLLGLYFTNKAAFWMDVAYGVITILVVVIGAILIQRLLKKRSDNRFKRLLDEIERTGQVEKIKQFIENFGFGDKRTPGFTFRQHHIDWNRIHDLEKDIKRSLESAEVPLKTSGKRDVIKLLLHYIQEKEESITREGVRNDGPHRFDSLSGTDFEQLLRQLFERAGYLVEWKGRTGDQGGDLVASKNGERILVQAKRYANNVGNAAIQQANTARQLYHCTRAMVMTSAEDFTPEAYAAAKGTGTELISKQRLAELLLQYLHENWW